MIFLEENMKKKWFVDILCKYNAFIQPILSFIPSVFFGFYIFRVETEMSKDMNLFSSIKTVGLTNDLIIALLFFVILVFYHYGVVVKPLKRFENNKENTINGLLASVTQALFISSNVSLEISSVVQVCNYRTKQREVIYQYNTSDMSFEKIDLYFGDVGLYCVKNKDFLMKEYTYEDWEQNNEEYKSVVPKDLRIILAKPIFDNNHNVIAVLEIDIYESTIESNAGSTKQGFLTDTVTVQEIKQLLTRRNVKIMFGKWANSISTLILN